MFIYLMDYPAGPADLPNTVGDSLEPTRALECLGSWHAIWWSVLGWAQDQLCHRQRAWMSVPGIR